MAQNLKKPVFLIQIQSLKQQKQNLESMAIILMLNFYQQILEVNQSTVKRADGQMLNIAEGICGDETAKINFRFVGEFTQCCQKNNVIAIRNGRSPVFQERQRLEIDRWGKLTAENVKIDKIGDQNRSDILYEMKVVKQKIAQK